MNEKESENGCDMFSTFVINYNKVCFSVDVSSIFPLSHSTNLSRLAGDSVI